MRSCNCQLMVIRGYRTRTELGSDETIQNLYAAAGTGIQLMFRPTVTGDLLHIAGAAFRHCPIIFEVLLVCVWGGGIYFLYMLVSCYGFAFFFPVCGMVHIKEPLLLIDKSSLCGGSGFPFSLSEWSLTICLMPYNRR